MPHEPTALLVLRVWREVSSLSPLRVEIRRTRDISAGFEESTTVVDLDTAYEIVRRWLEDVAATPPA